MGFGGNWGFCGDSFDGNQGIRNIGNIKNLGVIRFLERLSPGTCVVLQYDDRPPASGTFQGFQEGTVILTNFDGFPGLVHIAANRVNAVSVFSPSCKVSSKEIW